MFVKTPQGKMFPATLYYGNSNTSVGAWSPDYHVFHFSADRDFPQEFQAIINFSPVNFSEKEREEFIEALEFSLAKVPVSDFEGVLQHDMGNELMGIRSGKPFIIKLTDDAFRKLRKVDTWSYSILGNDEAWDFNSEFIKIAISHLTPEENGRYPREIPENLFNLLVERSYDQLVNRVYKKKSRLALMVLGCFLMQHKSKITEELRHEILKYSDWGYEKDQLKSEKDREERKGFLDDFREKIKNYDGSKKVKLPFYTVTRIIKEKKAKGDISPIWRHNIDYSIDN